MDDLTIVRLCAEAMGLTWVGKGEEFRAGVVYTDTQYAPEGSYNPLTNDAQAMTLVKRFGVDSFVVAAGWRAIITDTPSTCFEGEHPDLNRAICLAVANMQEAKG